MGFFLNYMQWFKRKDDHFSLIVIFINSKLNIKTN